MAYSHIAHDCILGKNVIIANSVNLAGHVQIEEFAIVGGACGIHQFIHIGKHAMIAASVMVRNDVPPYILAGREPLSYVGVNYRGLSRRNFSPETIKEIQEIYRIVFLSNNNNTQALGAVEKRFPISIERDEILSFIKNSKRGILKGYSFVK